MGLGDKEEQLGRYQSCWCLFRSVHTRSFAEDAARKMGFDTTECHLPRGIQTRQSCAHQVVIFLAITAVLCFFILWVTYRCLRASRVHDTYAPVEDEDDDDDEKGNYGIHQLQDDALFYFSGQSSATTHLFENI